MFLMVRIHPSQQIKNKKNKNVMNNFRTYNSRFNVNSNPSKGKQFTSYQPMQKNSFAEMRKICIKIKKQDC